MPEAAGTEAAADLVAASAQVPDSRSRRGIRHKHSSRRKLRAPAGDPRWRAGGDCRHGARLQRRSPAAARCAVRNSVRGPGGGSRWPEHATTRMPKWRHERELRPPRPLGVRRPARAQLVKPENRVLGHGARAWQRVPRCSSGPPRCGRSSTPRGSTPHRGEPGSSDLLCVGWPGVGVPRPRYTRLTRSARPVVSHAALILQRGDPALFVGCGGSPTWGCRWPCAGPGYAGQLGWQADRAGRAGSSSGSRRVGGASARSWQS
jgi:hypothetical protein